jgi:hypothetical protein
MGCDVAQFLGWQSSVVSAYVCSKIGPGFESRADTAGGGGEVLFAGFQRWGLISVQ